MEKIFPQLLPEFIWQTLPMESSVKKEMALRLEMQTQIICSGMTPQQTSIFSIWQLSL